MLRRIWAMKISGFKVIVSELLDQLTETPNIFKRIVQWYRCKSDDVWLPPIGDGAMVGQELKQFFAVFIGQQRKLATAGFWVSWGNNLKLPGSNIDFFEYKLKKTCEL